MEKKKELKISSWREITRSLAEKWELRRKELVDEDEKFARENNIQNWVKIK